MPASKDPKKKPKAISDEDELDEDDEFGEGSGLTDEDAETLDDDDEEAVFDEDDEEDDRSGWAIDGDENE